MDVQTWIAVVALILTIGGGLVHISMKIGRIEMSLEGVAHHRQEHAKEHEKIWEHIDGHCDEIQSLDRRVTRQEARA